MDEWKTPNTQRNACKLVNEDRQACPCIDNEG